MKKFRLLLIIALMLVLQSCADRDNELIGTYKTFLPKMIKSKHIDSNKLSDAARLMDWSLIVTSDHLVLKREGKEYLKMTYFRDGDCLIGEFMWSKQAIYYPIYFKDKDNAFSWGQHFIRIKE